MGQNKFHSAWGLYEYELPLTEIPSEVDNIWEEWLNPHLGLNPQACQEVLGSRFSKCSHVLKQLSNRVLEHLPQALLIYEGTPFFRLNNNHSVDRFISLPPEISLQSVQQQLAVYGLENHLLLMEFFSAFGGMHEQSPCSEIRFAGQRRTGNFQIEPASIDFDAGLEFLSEGEIKKRRNTFSRWLSGAMVLKGGDGEYWHIGKDGSVCWHECGEAEIGGIFNSIENMISSFVAASTDECLFEGVYMGFNIDL